jgi:hypothetical protein
LPPPSAEDVSFAQVYRFVGDMFDADAPVPVEAHLQKLKEMDNITTKTVSSSSLALLSLPLLPRVCLAFHEPSSVPLLSLS